MLDLKFIRENIELVRTNIQNKNESTQVDNILLLDESRRKIIQEVESLKNVRNVVTKEISELKKNKENADDKIAAMKEVSDKIKSLDDALRNVENEIELVVLKIPNMTGEKVPVGKSAEDNKIVRTCGTTTEQKLKRNHIEIAKSLDIIDFERGGKVSGSGFAFYKGKGAKLERAMINFMIDFHLDNHGYTELLPPFIVNRNSMHGTGQLPKMAEDMYHATEDDMFLIPTAEVPLTNFHNGEMLPTQSLPIKYCGYSPCFRREAGSYGKDVRGFLRVHQFNKVEMVNFVRPEDSWATLEKLTGEAEDIVKALGLHYRVLLLCSGDTSFSSAMTYDIEVWSPGEESWLEVSSCSNFTDFQARRANIRFKPDPSSKPEFIHTLNGSGLATSRIMVALLETYLNEDGSVSIPEALVPYTGFSVIEAK
ncbi:MAG: serine--tRNA ligase [Candidatus Kapabacteria bacterium]|nr:serine--tRNA ligase [Ignavibacteriota bacterium]MCW5884086.1 serine--tRNA ligase [Candidatus Kapabacteria bacterium]